MNSLMSLSVTDSLAMVDKSSSRFSHVEIVGDGHLDANVKKEQEDQE